MASLDPGVEAKVMAHPSLASHTLYHCEKEGLVTLRTASCAGGMQLLHAIA